MVTMTPYVVESRNNTLGFGSSVQFDTLLKEVVITNVNNTQLSFTFMVNSMGFITSDSIPPYSTKTYRFTTFMPVGTSYQIFGDNGNFNVYITGLRVE